MPSPPPPSSSLIEYKRSAKCISLLLKGFIHIDTRLCTTYHTFEKLKSLALLGSIVCVVLSTILESQNCPEFEAALRNVNFFFTFSRHINIRKSNEISTYLFKQTNESTSIKGWSADQTKMTCIFFTFYVFRKIGLNPFFKLTPSFFFEELKLFQKIVYYHCDGQ